MELRREPVVFGLTVLVVGFLAYGLYQEYDNPLRRPTWSKEGLDVPAVRIPDLAKFPRPAPPDASQAKRDLFAEPRDTRPLPKLKLGSELTVPEADPYMVLAPPPVPAPAPRLWSSFLRVPAVAAAPPPVDGDTVEPEETAESPETKPPEVLAQADVKLNDAVLERRYDRIVLREGGRAMWGRILNANKYDLKETDTVRFQLYLEQTDRAFGEPQSFLRSELLTVQLAKTTKNEFELRKRKIAWIAGNEAKMREFVLWCLAKGFECPEAFVEAEVQAKKAIELAPNDVVNYVLLGKVYEATFRYEDAWRLYVHLTTKAFPVSADAWVSRAQLEMRLHLDHDAIASFARATELDPKGWRPKFAAGEFWLLMGGAEKAQPLLEEARRNEPTEVELSLVRARIRCRLGEACVALGKLDEAADAFERARKADENDQEAATGLAAVHWLRRDSQTALQLLDAAIAAEPTMAAHVNRGLARLSGGDFAGAKRDFEAAVGIDPVRDVRPHSCLAFLYYRMGRRDEALAAVERALANEPSDAYSLYLRGRLRREKSAWDEARQDMKAAAVADLGFVDPIVELGILAAQEDLFDTADRYFTRALELDPKNTAVHALRGRNLLMGSQIRRARDAFLAATALDKNDPLSKAGLALCNYYEDDTRGMKVELAALRDNRPKGDRFQQYAEECLRLVEIHDQKEEWNDGFDRPTIARLPWNTVRVQGLSAQIVNGEVRVEGLFESSGVARIWQEMPARLFRAFEVDVRIPISDDKPDSNQANVTVFVVQEEKRQSQGRTVVTFEASITRERKKADGTAPILYRYRDRDEAPAPKEVTIAWPVGKSVRVRIERDDDDNNPRGRILVDNEIVASGIRFPRGAAGSFLIGVSADAETARTCSFALDNVRIVRKRVE